MVKFSCSATIELPADVYFTERDTDAFRRLQGKVLRLGDLEILDAWRQGEDRHVVRLVTRPSVRKYIPSALKKRLNFGEFAFEDCLEYHKDLVAGPRYQLDFHSIPPMFQDKIQIKGRLSIEPIDEHRCRQTLEGEAEINVFGVRSIAEPIIADALSKSYRQLPSVISQWIVLREEILNKEGIEGLLKGRPLMEWLPNSTEREMKCASYRSPFRKAILQSAVNMVRRQNRRHALMRAQRGESSLGILRNQQEEEFVHGHSDPDVSSELAHSSPRSNGTRDLSDFESSLRFHDAVEHLSVEDTTSWQSALSDPRGPSEVSVPGVTNRVSSSRRRLLHSCGFTQRDDSFCSQDEVIWRPVIREPSPSAAASVAGSDPRRKAGGKNWMCCRLRSGRHREDARCPCMCLTAFNAA